MKIIIFVLLLIPNIVLAYGSNFSCSYGKQGACLDYGDKICSSYSKCVSQSAQCFNENACGYGGFVCKSDLEDMASEYDILASKYRSLAQDYDDLVNDYNDLLKKHRSIKTCVEYAETIEDAKLCY